MEFIITKEASKKKPPKPVTDSAHKALFLESSLVVLKPIKKKEEMLVNSQNINRDIKLSDNTKPSIAPIKTVKYK